MFVITFIKSAIFALCLILFLVLMKDVYIKYRFVKLFFNNVTISNGNILHKWLLNRNVRRKPITEQLLNVLSIFFSIPFPSSFFFQDSHLLPGKDFDAISISF